MSETPKAAADSTSPLTVNAAAAEFARTSLLTLPEHEDTAAPATEESAAPVEPDTGAPSPEASPLSTESEATPEPGAVESPADGSTDETPPMEKLRRDLLADYTKKTQAAAELRKQADAELGEARTQRQQYLDRLKQVETLITQLQPAEPDAATLDALRKEDPSEYAAVVADLQRNKDRITALKAEQERVRQEDANARAKDFQKRVTEEREKLFTAVPEWKDPAKAKAASDALYGVAQEYGFPPEDIAAGMHDSRIVLLLRDAWQYRQLKAKMPQTQRTVQELKTATPGGKRTTDPKASEQAALERLQRTGRKDAAAEIFTQRALKG